MNILSCFILQYVKRLKAPIENIMTIELSKGNKGKINIQHMTYFGEHTHCISMSESYQDYS